MEKEDPGGGGGGFAQSDGEEQENVGECVLPASPELMGGDGEAAPQQLCGSLSEVISNHLVSNLAMTLKFMLIQINLSGF